MENKGYADFWGGKQGVLWGMWKWRMGPVVFKKPITTPDLVGTEARLKCGCNCPQSFNLPTYDNVHFCENILLHSSNCHQDGLSLRFTKHHLDH